jgi:predicted RNA-binding Zn ribbon-like protein
VPLTAAQFRKKGHGKTAPWVDLVNSEEWDTYGTRTDWLDDHSWLPFFLQQWRLASPAGTTFPVARFKFLRGTLRKSCEAIAAGRNLSEKELLALNTALNVTGRRRLIQGQHGLQVEFLPSSKGWDSILAQIAVSFGNLLASGNQHRIKICQNEDCRWIFYDTTKAQTRRWCSDKVCGNRERVRRARARMAR